MSFQTYNIWCCRGYVLFCWEDALGCSILSFSAWLGAGIVGFVYEHYIVYSSSVRGLGPDKVCWKLAMNRGFEVWGFYLSLYPSTIISFPLKMVWQSRVPPRVAFFSWSASLGKILTMDNLRKSCIIVLDWCYMCKRYGGSRWIIFFFIAP